MDAGAQLTHQIGDALTAPAQAEEVISWCVCSDGWWSAAANYGANLFCHQQDPLTFNVFPSPQMCRRVYKGIPLQVRGQVWSLLLDVEKMKKENEGKYEVQALPGKDNGSKVMGRLVWWGFTSWSDPWRMQVSPSPPTWAGGKWGFLWGCFKGQGWEPSPGILPRRVAAC